ncbi:MAG TPA: hypothetical protein VIV12_12450 [Streptosporangiaceae bacterium]
MKTFAELVDEAMKQKGWGYGRLSVKLGELSDGSFLNATQIRRLRTGQRQHLSRELVRRLAEVLDLDVDEAFHAAGLWPEGLDLEGYRRYKMPGQQSISTMRRPSWGFPGILGDLPEAA